MQSSTSVRKIKHNNIYTIHKHKNMHCINIPRLLNGLTLTATLTLLEFELPDGFVMVVLSIPLSYSEIYCKHMQEFYNITLHHT